MSADRRRRRPKSRSEVEEESAEEPVERPAWAPPASGVPEREPLVPLTGAQEPAAEPTEPVRPEWADEPEAEPPQQPRETTADPSDLAARWDQTPSPTPAPGDSAAGEDPYWGTDPFGETPQTDQPPGWIDPSETPLRPEPLVPLTGAQEPAAEPTEPVRPEWADEPEAEPPQQPRETTADPSDLAARWDQTPSSAPGRDMSGGEDQHWGTDPFGETPQTGRPSGWTDPGESQPPAPEPSDAGGAGYPETEPGLGTLDVEEPWAAEPAAQPPAAAPWPPQTAEPPPPEPSEEPWEPQPAAQPPAAAPWEPQPSELSAEEPAPRQRRLRRRRGSAPTEVDGSQFSSAPTEEPAPQQRRRHRDQAAATGPQPAAGTIRKAKISLIDGTREILDGEGNRLVPEFAHLVTITVRDGIVKTIQHDEPYDSIDAAARAAARRGGVVVWACTDARAVQIDAPDGSPRACRLADAAEAQQAFEPDVYVVRAGRQLIGITDPAARIIARRCELRAAAAGVEPRDGNWVRVGAAGIDMTMVKDGEIYDIADAPSLGTDSVRRLIAAGGDPVEVRAERVEQLAITVASQRREWMTSAATMAYVYLHGPGAKWAGAEDVLREASACLVISPDIAEVAPEANRTAIGHVPAAVLGYNSPPAFSTKQVLQSELRRAARKRWRPALAAGLMVLAMLVWSWRHGNSVEARIQDAKERSDNAWRLTDFEARDLADRAAALHPVVEDLVSPDQYAWQSLLSWKIARAQEIQGTGGHIGVELRRCESLDVVETATGGFEGVDALGPVMQQRAEQIFGPGAFAVQQTARSSFHFADGDSTDLRYTLHPPPEACSAEQG